ncbi:MAG: peptidylprolyl isomerase [Patescibacteria group bacterium]
MKKYLLPLLAISILWGAGCFNRESPVSLDKYRQAYASSEAANPANLQTQATSTAETVAGTSTQATDQAATQNMNQTNPESTAVSSTPTAPLTLAFPGILPEQEITKQVHVKTDKGDFWFELLPKEGPKAASNFVYLTKQKFYDGTTFHRYVPSFVIQGGDPLTKSVENVERYGTGGPGYKFEDDKVNLPYKRGIVAMANSGANTNGSQFFVVLADSGLDPLYSVFGRVTKGMEVVDKLRAGDKMIAVTLE